MCLTAPVRVISIDGARAVVASGDQQRVASTLAVPEVQPGDWAILAAGMLVRVLDPETARQITAAVRAATLDGSSVDGGEA
ncbi:MAG TPA: HypC/HybG/HupF family hydrogenase formation chaperone [Candidatus Limnocylindria bacterium]|nr:HypC/HybG/HupF family hydrogenase formation chaperone [Candidatus Limnocylindria bacterium]